MLNKNIPPHHLCHKCKQRTKMNHLSDKSLCSKCHYDEVSPSEKKCKKCKLSRKRLIKGLCNNCYRATFLNVAVFGEKIALRIRGTKSESDKVKQFLKKEKERLLDDLGKNPGKWLDSTETIEELKKELKLKEEQLRNNEFHLNENHHKLECQIEELKRKIRVLGRRDYIRKFYRS